MSTENLYTPDCIRTFTGKYVNVFDPKPEMFCIEDIAHSLSHQPRFAGHLQNFFSVAQHSTNCCHGLDGSKVEKFAALMHDASEAYLMDIPRPIKQRLTGYKEIENNLMNVLSEVFGFMWPMPESVKNIDEAMLQVEWDSLMLNKYISFPVKGSREAKIDFLHTFKWMKL